MFYLCCVNLAKVIFQVCRARLDYTVTGDQCHHVCVLLPGLLCEIRGPCVDGPCVNNATCSQEGANYTCSCTPGMCPVSCVRGSVPSFPSDIVKHSNLSNTHRVVLLYKIGGVHDKLHISSADWWDLLLPLA